MTTSRLHEMYRILRECGEDTACGCGCSPREPFSEVATGTTHPYLLKGHRSGTIARNATRHRERSTHIAAQNVDIGNPISASTPEFRARRGNERHIHKHAAAASTLANKASEHADKLDPSSKRAAIQRAHAAKLHANASQAQISLGNMHRNKGHEFDAAEADMVKTHHDKEHERLTTKSEANSASEALNLVCEIIRLRRGLKNIRRMRVIRSVSRPHRTSMTPARRSRSAVRKGIGFNRHRY